MPQRWHGRRGRGPAQPYDPIIEDNRDYDSDIEAAYLARLFGDRPHSRRGERGRLKPSARAQPGDRHG